MLNKLNNVMKSHGIENCEWEECDDMYVGKYMTVVSLKSGYKYRIFTDEHLLCFQYIDDESGDIVDIYFNQTENDVPNKLNELLVEYDNAIWEVYGNTDSLNYWYKCNK